MKAVSEAAVIGVPDPIKGQEVVCFCVLNPGHTGSDELRELVAQSLGKPLKPRKVKFAGDLPKTRNAKVMRRGLHNEPDDLCDQLQKAIDATADQIYDAVVLAYGLYCGFLISEFASIADHDPQSKI